jgi:dihydrofolate synthase/folylpolyglutamate synthase
MQIKGLYRDYTLETHNLGTFQIENVSVALLALDVLQMQGVFLPDNVIETGIKHMKHPGRMEIVHQRPLLILDGAHNPSAMDMLSKTIKHLFAKRHIIVVFGVMVDKAVDEIIVKLLSFADSVIVTSANISRTMKPAELVDHILKVSSNINMASSQTLAEGLRQALVLATNEDVIIVTGSLYLVGEARKFLRGYFANT